MRTPLSYVPFEERVYLERQGRLLKFLSERLGVSSALILSRPDYIYLSGFRGSAGYLLVTHNGSTLMIDGRYHEEAERDARGVELELLDWRENILEQVIAKLLSSEVRRVALDSSISHSSFIKLERKLTEAGVEVLELGSLIAELRRRKGPEEVQVMRSALSITESLMRKAILSLREGITELQVVAEFSRATYEMGSRFSFEPIVAFGENSALPHYKPSHRKLKPEDVVLLDWGNRYREYCSDITRTVALAPTEEIKRAFTAVKDAQERAIEHIRPGVKVSELDELARDTLRTYGLEERFIHALGHGVGVEIHEAPRLARSSEEILLEGDVVTIEPGVYIPGEFGVRLEVMVHVRADGPELLNKLPQELEVEAYS